VKHETELIAEVEGERVRLLSPGVGLFSAAVPAGRVLVPGEEAGVLRTLDVSAHLIVPAGVGGRVVSEPPRRVHQPVDYGTCLYELTVVGDSLVPEPTEAEKLVADGLVVVAPHAGRFWHSPAPGEPPFAAVGKELAEGSAVGVLEVMNTFNNVSYRAVGGLPPRARIAEVLVGDGDEVDEGQPLLAVEAR
jgi:acetyl-CoA carboxylase biotin carboxyl carrier protein